MVKLKFTLLALAAWLSVSVGHAEDSIYVYRYSEPVNVYGMAYLDSIWSDMHRQYLCFSFPKDIFELVPDTPGPDEPVIEWNPDATDEQKEIIRQIVRNMVYVQGGYAMIGAQRDDISQPNYYENAENREAPVHRVYLSSFYMNRYEITKSEWYVIMGNGSTTRAIPPDIPELELTQPLVTPAQDGLSWNDAKAFVDRLNHLCTVSTGSFCMPTEAQWEYAARGGGHTRDCVFSGSNVATQVGWIVTNSGLTVHTVGQLLPNELGIYDMTGNVFEWCQDWYGDYDPQDNIDPQGPAEGGTKVARGGCYMTDYSTSRNAYRMAYGPAETTVLNMPIPTGIRLAMTTQTVDHYLTLSPTAITADPQGGTYSVTVGTDQSFYVSYHPSWCSVETSAGQLQLTVNDNHSGDIRTGTVTVVAGSLTATVTITQDCILTVEGNLPDPCSLASQIVWSNEATAEQRDVIQHLLCNMVCVNGGSFNMGAHKNAGGYNNDPNANDDEAPVHEVYLSSYYLNKFQMTRGQYKTLMGNDPANFKESLNYPVESLSWNDAQAVVDMINSLCGLHFSLPTEAQWEYAARGGQLNHGYIYSGSNDVNEVGWVAGNANITTHDVGTKQPNELGIYDMTGNVYEWCSDWYHAYTSETEWNPTGAAEGLTKVGRGGCEALAETYARNSARLSYDPSSRTYLFYPIPAGVRLAMDYEEAVNLHLQAEYDTLVVNLGSNDNMGSIALPQGLDWCHANVADGKLTVYVQPNYSGSVREMTFQVSTFTKRMKVTVTQDYRETSLEDVIPPDILTLIGEGVITFNAGFNPPNIEGVYLASPHLLSGSSLSGDKLGERYSNTYYHFSNQTSSNTLDLETYQTAGAYDQGIGAFITGSENRFSAFFNMTGYAVLEDGNVTYKEAIVISGEKTASGIKDYSYTFVMVEKNDPNNNLVPVGTYRTFCDGDGLAQNSTWPLSNSRTLKKNPEAGAAPRLPLTNEN